MCFDWDDDWDDDWGALLVGFFGLEGPLQRVNTPNVSLGIPQLKGVAARGKVSLSDARSTHFAKSPEQLLSQLSSTVFCSLKFFYMFFRPPKNHVKLAD